jgi:hypothetical protein
MKWEQPISDFLENVKPTDGILAFNEEGDEKETSAKAEKYIRDEYSERTKDCDKLAKGR